MLANARAPLTLSAFRACHAPDTSGRAAHVFLCVWVRTRFWSRSSVILPSRPVRKAARSLSGICF